LIKAGWPAPLAGAAQYRCHRHGFSLCARHAAATGSHYPMRHGMAPMIFIIAAGRDFHHRRWPRRDRKQFPFAWIIRRFHFVDLEYGDLCD